MTPQEFIAKWRNVELKERTASQSHFNDLCRLLEIDEPITADPKGEWFTFEKGASKTSGGEGWADVWRKDCFAWEYKGKRANLDKAFDQLLQYAIALENPPLLIVSDMNVIRIHTNWTNSVQKVYTVNLDDLTDAANRKLLRDAFVDPITLKPAKTRQMVTEQAAKSFAGMAQRLRDRGHAPEEVAHFVNRLVFCMFAEDVELLPKKMFEEMIKISRPKPETFADNAKELFAAMGKKGGKIGFTPIQWFNGGLFDSDDVLPLESQDLDDLIRASALDWSDIDPSSGTLQVDGYTGYNALTKPGRNSGPVKLAYCWAHARRKLKEVHDRDGSPIAAEGLKRIAKFYKIEKAIRGQSAEQRKAARQEQTKPLMEDFEVWLKTARSRISAKSRLGEKLSYIAKYMGGLKLFLDDGTVEMDSNIVERAIRPIALNRKNALFAGHDEGGRTWARIASIIETCKLNDVEPYAYLKATLEAIAAGHPAARIDELMPWNYPLNPRTERLASNHE